MQSRTGVRESISFVGSSSDSWLYVCMHTISAEYFTAVYTLLRRLDALLGRWSRADFAGDSEMLFALANA